MRLLAWHDAESLHTFSWYAPSSSPVIHHGCVVCKPDYSVAGVGWSAGSNVEVVQEWAQHASLWRACAQSPGGEKVGSEFECLWTVCEEVFNPGKDERVESEVREFGLQNVLVFQVIQQSVESEVYGIFS